MTSPAQLRAATAAEDVTDPGRPLGWWGIVLLVMTEAMLFTLLLFTYYLLRGRAQQWPPAGIEDPELVKSGIRSVLLFASSATMSWADRGIRKGRQRRLTVGLAVTMVLAVVFLAGHVEEMVRLPEQFTWRTNAYGSLFYVITNFHALHLTIGVMILLFTYLAARRGAFTADSHLGVTTASIYWHFVDIVWAAVYFSLYLLPHLTAG